MNWTALESYLRAAHASARVGAEPGAERGSLKVDAPSVFAYRARVMGLEARTSALAVAAYAGLQDSAPRSALLSLHARASDIELSSWDDPSLAQIWFRLGADYVVPRADLGVFTIGTMPRDTEQAAALDELGDLTLEALNGSSRRTRDIESAFPHRHLVRAACVSGKITIRWDARTTEVIPTELPEVDREVARRDLAHRFLHWFGPASVAHFARWAAIPKDEAVQTWDAIAAELVPVDLDGGGRWIIAADEAAVRTAEASRTVRLLPMGDPYLYLDHPPVPSVPEVGPDVSQRLVNSLGGRILVDGELVGAWGRVQNKVTLFPWVAVDRDRIEAEAHTFSAPIGNEIRIRWLSA